MTSPLTPAVRRRVALAGFGAGASLALAGCGFKLATPAPLSFRSLALTGFAPRSPLAEALSDELQRQVRIESDPARAELILQSLADARERRVVASTAAAQVRELQLRLRFRFRTQTPAGREITAPTELLLARDLSWSETQALAKQHEEGDLYRDMQADVVAQVMRRLSAIRL